MKNLILSLVLMTSLSGCALALFIPDKKSDAIAGETEESIRKIALQGKTTNFDILKRFKKPTAKLEYSDSRFSYIYSYWDHDMKDLGWFSGIAEMEVEQKTATFIFKSSGVLEEFLFDDKFQSPMSNYSSLDQNSNNKIKDVGFDDYHHIKLGSSKGYLFRTLGKPTFDNKHQEKEYWSYSKPPFREQFIFEFVNEKVHKKYVIKEVDLNKEELSLLNNL